MRSQDRQEAGHPSKQALVDWVDKLAPGERAVRSATTSYDLGDKTAAVMALEAWRGCVRHILAVPSFLGDCR